MESYEVIDENFGQGNCKFLRLLTHFRYVWKSCKSKAHTNRLRNGLEEDKLWWNE